QDKDLAGICGILAPFAERIRLTPVPSERSTAPHQLAQICRQANPEALIQEYPCLSAALADAASDQFVMIAGSLYLVGEAMELLHLSPRANLERELNEWRAA